MSETPRAGGGDAVRNMSFALTTPQILARTKTVTRRVGWRFLKPGDLIQAIERGQGLRKGQKVRRLAVIRVESVKVERLAEIEDDLDYGHVEVALEGFPGMKPVDFVDFFMETHGIEIEDNDVTRIEFSYVDLDRASGAYAEVPDPRAQILR